MSEKFPKRNDVIQALEYCADSRVSCIGCPYMKNKTYECYNLLKKDAIEIIRKGVMPNR